MRKILLSSTLLSLLALASGPATAAEAGADVPEPAVAEKAVPATPETPACPAPDLATPDAEAFLANLGQLPPEFTASATTSRFSCSDLTPCNTVADCPCAAPDCACTTFPHGTCGFRFCICRTYCFGGGNPP